MASPRATGVPPAAQGEPLARLCGTPMETGHFLRLALNITRALGDLQLKNISCAPTPDAILVNPQSLSVALLCAATTAPDTPSPAPSKPLPYLSPEETGRINRAPDQRSAFYTLGVTFYQMLTGTLPFTADNALDWVHCHLARPPRSPQEIVAGIPPVLSRMVLKLLAKNAEERYQSTAGLEADLERCLRQWLSTKEIEDFPLGEADLAEQLFLPQRLYGREHEVASLNAAFRAAVESGTPHLVTVSGSSGVGKTSLVQELHGAVIERGGFFLSGKAESYLQEVPYRCISQAFGMLIKQLLTQPQERIVHWKRQLDDALGENAPLLLTVIPELSFIIGAQPAAAQLSQSEEKRRLALLLRTFLAVFAPVPLVIFLDDVHYADYGTCTLLEQLVDRGNGHLLVVVTFLAAEVAPGHPLRGALERIGRQVPVQAIHLAPLPETEVLRFLADTFRAVAPPLEPLAEFLHQKTGGVPLYLKQMLQSLYDRGLLRFDRALRHWTWNLEQIAHAPHDSTSLVDLVLSRLKSLQPETRGLLQLAACIGNCFTPEMIAAVTSMGDAPRRAALEEAVSAGILAGNGADYCFPHDDLREALYRSIPAPQRVTLHRQIGRRLLMNSPPAQLEDRLFELVSQLNYGASESTDQEERVQLAALNLRAGRKARSSVAYDTALGYLSTALRLLPPGSWQSQRQLRWELLLELAQTLFLSGALKRADSLCQLLLRHAETKLEQAAVYRVMVDTATTAGADGKAVESALGALALFGITIPPRPTAQEVADAYQEVWNALGTRSIEALVELPRMTDTDLEAALDILARLYAPAYHLDNNLFFVHLCRGVTLSLTHGNAPASVHFFGWFGVMLASAVCHRPQEGYRFARAAYQLMERQHFVAYRAKALMVLRIISYWTQPIERMLQYASSAFRAGVETGDVLVACFSCIHTCIGLLIAGRPLEDVHRELVSAREFVRRAGYREVGEILLTMERFVETMQNGAPEQVGFDEAETTFTPGRMPTMVFYHHVTKLMGLYFLGRYPEALEAGEKARQLIWAGLFSSQGECLSLYYALTVAALFHTYPPEERDEALALIEEHLTRLKEWEGTCPSTFTHRRALLAAELARCRGEKQQAMQLYEESIASAREHGFLQHEALGFELAARFYRQCGQHLIAEACLAQSCTLYSRWGAEGKVARLRTEHPDLARDGQPQEAGIVGRLDTMAVVKACQAISSATSLPALLETLMRIVLKNAGGRRGLLLLEHGDELLVEAEARVDGGGVEVLQRVWAPLSGGLPLSVIQYVRRTRQRVLLDDIATETIFSLDPYLMRQKPASVLCLPIQRHDTSLGLLYLENDLTKGAFSAERVVVLEMLAAQAVISLENIRQAERFRALLESAPDAMVIVDDSGKIIMVNSQLQRTFGYQKEELVGRDVEVLIPQRFRAGHAQRRGGYTLHPRFRPMGERLDLRGVRKDGSEFPVDISLSPLRTEEGLLITAAIRDVSERKRDEEALRYSEARYRALHRDNPAMILTIDTDLKVITANPKAAAQLGHHIEELEGLPVLDLFHEEERAAMEVALRECLANPQQVQRWYARKIRKDRRIIWVEGLGQAVPDLSGNMTIMAVCQDITKRKEAEDALQQSEQKYRQLTETLEQRVRESVAELRQKDEILTIQGRQAVMGEMISNIAHQWRQPLNTLGLLAQELEMTYSRGALTAEAMDASCKKTMALINHMSKTIDDFRNFFRPEKEKVEFRAMDALGRSLSLLEGTFKTSQILIDLKCTCDPVIAGYPNEFAQALINILLNARDAFVARRVAAPVITIELHEEGKKSVVTITDNAGGIPEDILERIFDPYFTTKGPDKGTGVGLFMAKTIIEKNMAGTLRASNVENGARFRIVLPHR